MKVAVIRFPGSNCDQDALFALRNDVSVASEFVWHDDHSLSGFDAVFLPGGFSYGDYLRCGAIASRSSIMSEVIKLANDGRPVIGACNGFQVLTEAGLLAGALMRNDHEKFTCKRVTLEAVSRTSFWTQNVKSTVILPIAHGEGRFTCDADTLKRLQDDDLIAFRYAAENPNGSLDNIAGLVNPAGNVLGLMPHPERATRELRGGRDGLQILGALTAVLA